MTSLTKAQHELLSKLSNGQRLCHSQDGETCWLWPAREVLSEASFDDLRTLRREGLIADETGHDDEAYRFSPAEIITPAGRAALKEAR